MRPLQLIVVLLLLGSLQVPALAAGTIAYPNATLRSFLSTYLPNSTVISSSYYNVSVGNLGYVLVQQNTSFSSFAIVNVTSASYSLVTSNATAYNAVSPLLIRKFYPTSSTIANLSTTMSSFRSGASTALTYCLGVTGLQYYTCTAGTPLTKCIQLSCDLVELCGGAQSTPKSAITQFGIPSPFAYGVLNFSIAYQSLNASYNGFFSLLSGLNQVDYGSNIAGMQTDLANVTTITATMQNNPLFPLPANMTYSSVGASCGKYAANNGPWWCYATGYCGTVPFNQILLNSIKVQLQALQALPVSGSALSSVAINSTTLDAALVNKVTAAQRTSQLNAFLTSISPSLNSTVMNVTLFLSHIKNASLSSSLLSLQTAYASIKSKGISQNVTLAQQNLSSQLANVITLYNTLNTQFGGAFVLAANNTRLILIKELSFKSIPLSLATLAARQAQINAQISTGVNASIARSLVSNLTSIKGSADLTFIPIYGASLVKSFDGGVIDSLLAGSTAPIASKLSGGVFNATLFSLVIALVLILVFYVMFYRRMKAQHKIMVQQHRVRRAWRMLFAAMLAVAIIYVALTYVYASNATGFLPYSGFISVLRGSPNVFVAYNSTVNSSVLACAGAVSATLQGLGKGVTTIALQNYSCIASSNSTLVGTSCLNRILATGRPLIILGQGTNSSIVHKGLYGQVVYATGSAASGPSCLLNYAVNYR